MAHSGPNSGGSLLLAEEYFNSEDGRFVDALREVQAPKQLAGFVDRWKRDPRPWARGQIFAYLAQPLDCLGHNVVVKRLFKHAEASRDDELMARFLVIFDCLVRRQRKKRWHYDWDTRETWSEEVLATPKNAMPLGPTTTRPDPWTGKPRTAASYIPPNARLFSYQTRYYLRRRVWRYFRRMGYQRPDEYVPAVAGALAAYTDDDLARGENILDSWGLVQACFRAHEALEFGTAGIRLREGRSLNELGPAPRFPELWRKPESMKVLLELVTGARSRLVRVWAIELVKREHEAGLAAMPIDEILPLLGHDDEEIQAFAAELLKNCSALATMPISTWLRLLGTTGASALQTICEAMQEHVTADRLDLADCIGLGCAEPAPVARMGLEFLKARKIESAEDREAIAAVAGAQCSATCGELAAWALEILGTPQAYDRDLILRFFDSLKRPVRESAWGWLNRDESPGYGDAALWCRLLETPYDELRLSLVDSLERRASLPGTGSDELTPVWCSVLVGVHRGGRQKAKAAGQIARALEKDPSRADALLPVLAVAVRSVRRPEARAGLAAVVGAVEARPELAEKIQEYLPELKLPADEVKA